MEQSRLDSSLGFDHHPQPPGRPGVGHIPATRERRAWRTGAEEWAVDEGPESEEPLPDTKPASSHLCSNVEILTMPSPVSSHTPFLFPQVIPILPLKERGL